MKRISIPSLAVIICVFGLAATATPILVPITFDGTPLLDGTPVGSLVYDSSNSLAPYSNFTIQWYVFSFDFTSQANSGVIPISDFGEGTYFLGYSGDYTPHLPPEWWLLHPPFGNAQLELYPATGRTLSAGDRQQVAIQGGGTFRGNFRTEAIPEPTSLVLTLGGAALVYLRKSRAG